MENSTILIFVGILLVSFLLITILINRKRRMDPERRTGTNYKVFFIIGITWIPLGISTGNYVFAIVGIAMMILGISNKKKWRKEPKWSELSPEDKRTKLIIISVLTFLLLAGILTHLLY